MTWRTPLLERCSLPGDLCHSTSSLKPSYPMQPTDAKHAPQYPSTWRWTWVTPDSMTMTTHIWRLQMTTRTERLKALQRDADRLASEVEQLKQMPDAETQLDELAQEYMRASKGTYSEALLAVRKAHPELAAEFVASFGVQKTATRS